jgi:hypothetical protein
MAGITFSNFIITLRIVVGGSLDVVRRGRADIGMAQDAPDDHVWHPKAGTDCFQARAAQRASQAIQATDADQTGR